MTPNPQITPKSYWQKQEKPLFPDLEWNFPEQKTNKINVIGGNLQNFSTVVRTAEHIAKTYPIKTVSSVLPEALKPKLPPSLPDIIFTPATPSGSFDKSEILIRVLRTSDFNLIVGDLSKNSTTCIALSDAIKNVGNIPFLLTRDAVDLLTPEASTFIAHENLHLLASLVQLQKLFRSLYYPKMLLLSMPLIPIIETLHKFTLSYPNLTLTTFHQNQILAARSGKIITTPLELTPYSPLTIWGGKLAAKITVFNLWNPGKPLEATAAAIAAI